MPKSARAKPKPKLDTLESVAAHVHQMQEQIDKLVDILESQGHSFEDQPEAKPDAKPKEP